MGRGQAEDWLLDIGLAAWLPLGYDETKANLPGAPPFYSVDYPSWIWDEYDHVSILKHDLLSKLKAQTLLLSLSRFLSETSLLLRAQLKEANIEKSD